MSCWPLIVIMVFGKLVDKMPDNPDEPTALSREERKEIALDRLFEDWYDGDMSCRELDIEIKKIEDYYG